MTHGTRSSGQIPITRFHDSEGRPTCCLLWGSKADTCPLLRVQGLKGQEVCNWTERRIQRRDDYGLLVPVEGCPVHPWAEPVHASHDNAWKSISSAPAGQWLVCRNAQRRVFQSRREIGCSIWIDVDGLYRDPVEWIDAPID